MLKRGVDMAIDGIILNSVNKSLQDLLPFKIVKFQQVSKEEMIWVLRSNRQNYKLFISLHSVYNRINFTNKDQEMQNPFNFVMVLRKHLEGAIITIIEQVAFDRILHMIIQSRNSLGDSHDYHIYLELMGKYANMILVDSSGKIIDAYKRIPPFENSKRIIHPGANYTVPPAHVNKIDPFTVSNLAYDSDFANMLHGFSPILSREVSYRIKNGENYNDIIQHIKNSTSLFATELSDKYEMHIIPLTHLSLNATQHPLHEGFDIIYQEQEDKIRIKQSLGDLYRHIDREYKRNKRKLDKLKGTYEKSLNNEHFRVFGDLIFANLSIDRKEVITLQDFTTNENISIPIDMRYDLKQNANIYYQKYHKAKRAISILQQQISNCEDEISYFEDIRIQLQNATLNDAAEIKNELEQNGYIRKDAKKKVTKKKNAIPNFLTLYINDTTYYIGKNNIQNAYITWNKAHKSDTWLHVAKMHGSHVIIACEHPNEQILRDGAMLAAHFSEAALSSSIPIDYTNINQLKKIPNQKGSSVIMNFYKTIYIDIDQQHIADILKQTKETK